MSIPDVSIFCGGVHPTDGSDKKLSKDNPIVDYRPDRVEISMSQSGGSICKLLVTPGEYVKKGQLIGVPANFLAANIHASVSGVVTEIKTVRQYGAEVPICVIEADKYENESEEQFYQKQWMNPGSYTRTELLEKIQACGLVGMGGAGFPVHIKYRTESPIDTVLINGCECESYLTCDYRMMLEYPMAILNGVLVCIKAAGAKRAVICLEENKRDCAEIFCRYLKETDVPVKIKLLPVKYPQGGERQLIYAVTGQELKAGNFPADMGIIVSNIQTAKAMADCAFADEPCISRCVTVSGLVEKPQNYLVPVGTPFRDLLALSGGKKEKCSRVISGGPMTGFQVSDDEEKDGLNGSVAKTSGGLLVLKQRESKESPCIHCGACAGVCPAGLTPFQIDFAIRRDQIESCERMYASECIGCGCCSYICPARRELTFYTVMARNKVKALKRERGK